MTIRTLIPALSLLLNIQTVPALAQALPRAEAPASQAERTMAQNRSIALPLPGLAVAAPPTPAAETPSPAAAGRNAPRRLAGAADQRGAGVTVR